MTPFTPTLTYLYVAAHSRLLHYVQRLRDRDDSGQASAEYALVLLGAAAVALLVVAWATKTQGIQRLLDRVLRGVTDKANL